MTDGCKCSLHASVDIDKSFQLGLKSLGLVGRVTFAIGEKNCTSYEKSRQSTANAKSHGLDEFREVLILIRVCPYTVP